jgi:threonine dehydratase
MRGDFGDFQRREQAMDGSATAIDREQIAATYERIRPHIRRTPLVEVAGEDLEEDLGKDLGGDGGGARLVLKLELMQHAGSFKARGAFANMLLRKVPPAGVAAASGGNHGAGVAYAARKLGHAARIFVPSIASPAKQALIRGYGAELTLGGERYDDVVAACERHAAETGALQIHAYDQRETMLGQGSVGLELEQDAPGLDTLFVAVGGGGLIGGIAAWYGGRIDLIGVEPELAPTLHDALAAGRPVDAKAGGLAADSLAPRRVGELMFPIARRHVSRVMLVPDAAIRRAQEVLWRALRIVAEPGGATALAPLLAGLYRPRPGERIGVLLCGANTTAVNFG